MKMLRVLCLTLLTILTVAIAPALSVDAHVFVIAGQSNAVGLNTDGYTDEDKSDPRILQLSCCGDDGEVPTDQCTIILAQDPLHHQCDGYYLGQKTLGFSMTFARQYLKDLPATDEIILVPAARSATGFFENTWTAYNGTGFIAAVEKVKRTFSLLQQANVNPIFEGVLWHQGEYDAGDNFWGNIATTDLYLYTDMIPLINAFRDTNLLPFSSQTLPFTCANLLPSWVANETHPLRVWVANAISFLDDKISYTACTPSQGLVGDPGTMSGLTSEKIHFTGASQRILGRRYYAAWKLAKENRPQPLTNNLV